MGNPATWGDLDITGDVEIASGEGGATIASGLPASRILRVREGAQVAISGVALKDGRAVRGGAILNDGQLDLTNVTLSGNLAYTGGGIFNRGDLTLSSVTIARNYATTGGGIANQGGTVTLGNTLIGRNRGRRGPDCFGTLTSLGHNLIEEIRNCTLAGTTTGNVIGKSSRGPAGRQRRRDIDPCSAAYEPRTRRRSGDLPTGRHRPARHRTTSGRGL